MKLLVLSNNPISERSSNGRTILNLLLNFKEEDICNIFVNGQLGDIGKRKYYRVKEKNLLKRKKPYLSQVKNAPEIVISSAKRVKKTPLKCLVRSLVWENKSLYKEILMVAKSFSPDAILIQCGDSDFLIKIANFLSKVLSKPLISFNSEDYIFKKWDYLLRKQRKSVVFKVFMNRLIKAYNDLYKVASGHIYLTSGLQKEYLIKYPGHRSIVLYNSSTLCAVTHYFSDGDVVYSGNLGVGRLDTLVKLSKIIFELSGKRVVVCSNTIDERTTKIASDCPYFDFRGSLSYADNVEILKRAKLLLHIESFEEYYLLDTKNAFSTKIADSLRLGIPLFVLAPRSSYVYSYFDNNKSCFLSDNLVEAKKILENILFNKELLEEKGKLGSRIGELNHDASANSKIFVSFLEDVCYDV